MDLAALRTELLARGANYLDASGTTRQDRFINRGYHRICNAESWPFLWTSTTGTAPKTITDVRNVRAVVDTTNERRLTYLEDRAVIDEVDPTLSTTGTPQYWFFTDDDTIDVYPANTSNTLKVYYVKFPTDLSTGDTPIVPTRFHLAIIDAAMCEVYKDTDDWQLRAAARQDLEETLEEMRDGLLYKSHTDPDTIRLTSYQDF